jgi:O-antigen ligase
MSARSGDSNGPPDVPLFDRVLFLVLTAVLCARPMISESFARASFSFLPIENTGGTTPATTVWLDAILLVSAVLVWIRNWRRVRRGLTSVALTLLLAAVVVSVAAAVDKRQAANAGAHVFITAFAAAALVRVLRTRWMVHLLLAAVLASGVANAAKCMMQRAYEFEDSLRFWHEQKAALIANGVDVETPTIINYERRLRSSQAFGYVSHPNVAASCLTMCLLAAVGLAIGMLRRSDLDVGRLVAGVIVSAALVAALAIAAWLTGSMGAGVSAVVAGVLLLVLGTWRNLVAKHPRGACSVLVGGYLAVIAIGAAYGMLKGTLPHTSLAFRWQYWQAAARAYADAPLTGLGRENFRSAYLLYKPAESTEEVANPHNLWLTLLVELGPLGLLAGTMLVGVVIYAALRAVGRAERLPPTRAGPATSVAVPIAVLLAQALFSGTPFGAPGILILWVVYVAGIWALAFVVAHRLITQVDVQPGTARWLAAGLFAGLCAALVHNLIGVSLFTTAGLAMFVSLAAATVALLSSEPPAAALPVVRGALARRSLAGVGGVLLVAAYVWLVGWPTFATRGVQDRIVRRFQAAASVDSACAELAQARQWLSADPWDADLPSTLARLALEGGRDRGVTAEQRTAFFDLAESYAQVARSRSPGTFAIESTAAAIKAERADVSQSADDLRAAALQSQIAVSRYPTNPRAQISAGDAAYNAWRATQQSEYLRQAVDAYQAALEIDATREPEVAAKLRAFELDAVRARLDDLRAAGLD